VQDPDEAIYRTMPESAIAYGGDAVEVMSVDRIAARLYELANGHLARNPGKEKDVSPTGNPGHQHTNGGSNGEIAPDAFLTCPDCGGVLTETDEGGVVRFRCRIGHQYSEQSLVALHRDGLEYALWMAVRALKERADLSTRVAERFRLRGHDSGARRFERDAEASRGAMATLQRTIGSLEPPPPVLEEGLDA
jgi:two-component system, chemotaxis family, protein-glutamate methylesterase/glutaminase